MIHIIFIVTSTIYQNIIMNSQTKRMMDSQANRRMIGRSTALLPFQPKRRVPDTINLFTEQLLVAILWCISACDIMDQFVRMRCRSMRRWVSRSYHSEDDLMHTLHHLKRDFQQSSVRIPDNFVNSLTGRSFQHCQGLGEAFNRAYYRLIRHVCATPLFLTVVPHSMLLQSLAHKALDRNMYYLYAVEDYIGTKSIESVIMRGDKTCLTHLSPRTLRRFLPQIFESIAVKLPIGHYLYIQYDIDPEINVMAQKFLRNALACAGPTQFCADLCGVVANYCFDEL